MQAAGWLGWLTVAAVASTAFVPMGLAAVERVRPLDLVRYPTSFAGRIVQLEGVVVVRRFGQHVFMVEDDDAVRAAATLAVINPRAYERVRVGERLTVIGILKGVRGGRNVEVADRGALETGLAQAGVTRALVARSIHTEDGRELVAAPTLDRLEPLRHGARVAGRRVGLPNVIVRRCMGPRAFLVVDSSGADAVVRLRRQGLQSHRIREGDPVSVTGVVRKAPAKLAEWHPETAEAMKTRTLYVDAGDVQPLAAPWR